MSREIQETELPGIGRRFDLAGIDGTVSVVIHHSGRRDMYVREARPRDEPTTLALTDHQARQLGAILAGAYFTPAAVEEMEAVIGDLLAGKLVDSPDDELLTVAFVGLAVLVAGMAAEIGVSEAIGAFLVGMILAETTAHDRIERLVLPLRDTFAALFFFAFGVSIDVADVGDVLGPVLAAVVVSSVLTVAAGVVAARLNGFGARAAANIGTTMLGRGEFSLILATLALAAGLDDRLGPFVAGFVLVTALLGPVLAANSRWVADRIPRRLVPEQAPT
jgi:K+:H+ antiporter subunit KhtU